MCSKVVPFNKRLLDLTIIILTLPISFLIFLLIAGYIKFRSPGPIFFKQKRIGFGGVPFDIIKFRTMAISSDETVHKKYISNLVKLNKKMIKLDDDDPRIIPGGKFIRASGLDELPQIINILKGEMSIVGPRPCTIDEKELFHDKTRFDALPGLTGLWQIKGKNETTFLEMVKLDSIYVNNRNLWSDINIMIGTPFILLTQIKKLTKRSNSIIKEFDIKMANR